MCKMAIKNHLD